jgi:YVTN family beta-propeller protein
MINTEANIYEAIDVGISPIGVALSPNNDYVYVTNNGDDSLSIISTDDNSLFVTLRDHYYINYNTSDEAVFDKPYGVTVGTSGQLIYVVNSGSNKLKILNASTVYSAGDDFDWGDYDAEDNTVGPYSLSSTIDVGNDPRCIVLNSDESYAYITNYEDDTVTVIDITNRTVTDTINVGDGPIGISITPTGDYLYVVNHLDNSVSVIYTNYSGEGKYDKNQVIATIGVGTLPVGFGNFIGGSVPKAPSDLSVSLVGDSGAKLTWTDNSDDELYFRVWRKKYSSGTYYEIATLNENTTEYSDSGLEQAANYYYAVCAYNEMGDSEYTDVKYITTPLASGCFIATAAYGSYTETHVRILRDFRDRFLLKDKAGRAFVKFYYKYSPGIADYISRHEFIRAVIRLCLLPIIVISWVMLSIGPFSIFLMPIFVILVLATIIMAKKKFIAKHRI